MTASGSGSWGMCSFFAVLRNRKVKHCAGRVLSYGPEPTSMGLKNGPANGESHAHAAGLRRVERVKDLVYRVGGDPAHVWKLVLGRPRAYLTNLQLLVTRLRRRVHGQNGVGGRVRRFVLVATPHHICFFTKKYATRGD